MIVEVEKDSLEAVFYSLKESYKNIFKDPSKEMIEDFIADKDGAIIVKPLISEAPITKMEGIPVPALEKILVDILTEKELFYFLQGNELINIYKNAMDKYTVRYSKLLRYAKRRGRETEITELRKQINGKLS